MDNGNIPCGNCGGFREIGDDFIVEKCPECGDDEYEFNDDASPFGYVPEMTDGGPYIYISYG